MFNNKPRILNQQASGSQTFDPAAVAENLKKGINVLKGNFYDLETGRVKYDEMKGSQPFAEYAETAAALKQFELQELKTPEAMLAFWINIYNALTVHGIVELGVENSVKEIGLSAFFGRVAYQIGQHVFTLDDIEHGILRRNQKKHLFARRFFGSGDPRAAFIMPYLEPRIHFTLVCASKSCPPIGVYREQQLEQQLKLAAGNFINSENVVIQPERKQLSISKIFQWYGKDFGNKNDLLQFIADYRSNEADKAFIRNNLNQLSLVYQHYDWNLNA